MTSERRRSERVQVELVVTLSRHHGGPINGHTVDLAAGGMRVATTRPLRADELLDFSVPLEDQVPVEGRARVMREHARNVYALRFELVAPAAQTSLSAFVRGRL